ncbi:hypothetical protein SprV_0301240400 [Sparganum proliferum]
MNRLKIEEIKRRRYSQNPRTPHVQPPKCSVERPIAFVLGQKHDLLHNCAPSSRNRGSHAVDGSTRSKADRLSMCILPTGHKASKIVHNDAPTHHLHLHRSQRDESQLRQRVLMEAVTIVSGWMYEEPCFIDPSVYGEGNARHIDEVRQRLRAFRAGISSSVMEQLAAAARRCEATLMPPALPSAAAVAAAATALVHAPSKEEPSTPSVLAVATLTSSGRQPKACSTLYLPPSGSAYVCTPNESIYAGDVTSKLSEKACTPHGSRHGQTGQVLDNRELFGKTESSKPSCKFSAPSACTHLLSPAVGLRRTVVYFTNEHLRHVSPGMHRLIENFSPGPKDLWLPTRVGSIDIQDCGPVGRAHRRNQVVRGHECFDGGNGDHHSHSHHCRHSTHHHPCPLQASGSAERVCAHHDDGYKAPAFNVDLDNSLRNRHGELVRSPRAPSPVPRDRESPECVSALSAARHPIWDTPDVLKTSTQYLSLDL